MAERVSYVYAIVAAGIDASAAPAGLDEAPVIAVTEGGLAALVSEVEEEGYTPERLSERSGELSWLGPRARAHDRVVIWASDSGPAVPLPMFSLFRNRQRIQATLRERAGELEETLRRIGRGREYVVRVFRIDAVLANEGVARLSERIASLEQAAAAASPGQRYLIERKLEGERKAEARRIASDVARETLEALSSDALDAVADALPARAAEEAAGTAVLNAAFLVAPQTLDSFRATLTDRMDRYGPLGFRFEFTGPWPAYHFVRERVSGG